MVFALAVMTSLISRTCSLMTYTVQEEQEAGAFVADVRSDSGLSAKYNASVFDSLRFRLRYNDVTHQMFNIDATSGVLTTAQVIDREQVCVSVDPCHLDIDVRASQATGSGLDLIKFVVEVTDVNDHEPSFPDDVISRSISESTD